MDINPISLDLKEACLSKGFSSTLTGLALKWLLNVPPYSITLFAHLINLFNSQFSCSRTFERLTSDLYRVIQNLGESFRDYVNKFGKESLDIPNLDVATAVEAFKMGLRKDSQFYEDLVMNPCRNLDEVRNRALRFIRLEDDKKIQQRMDAPTYYSQPNQKTKTAPFKPYRSKLYSKPDNCRINAVEDDEEEEEYPKLFEYCFSLDTSGLLYAVQDLGDKARWPPKRNAKEAKTEKGDRPVRTSSLTEEKVISFNEEDRDNVQDPHHDGLVITLYVANHFIRRILIDGGSSVNIIQHVVLKRMGIPESKIISKSAVLTLDTRHESGTLDLPPMCQDAYSLGSSEDQQGSARCRRLDVLEAREQDVKELSLSPEDPDVKVLIGTSIPEDIEQSLIRLLKSRTSTFAWKHEDMTCISKDVITHKLGIDNSFRPIHQKRRNFAQERNTVIQEEVERLLKARMIKEVKFPRWLVNVVVVQKKNRKWRLEDHPRDLEEALDILDHYNMKLNPSKCHFGVGAGKFLGYMKNKLFEWGEKHEQALQSLKEYLSTTPLLMKPEDGEPLSLYLAVSGHSVSTVLVKDHEGQQHPVYYVSKSLLSAETRYSHLEKLILALIMASTKHRHYFETHAIHVKTNYPIKCVLRKPEMFERMAKWSVKLSAYDLIYEPRTVIKSQALADFVTDFSSDIHQEADLEVQQLEESKDTWILFTYGASNIRGICLGIILKSPQGDILPQSISCEFQATNNEAEYEALIAGLQLAYDMKIRYLQVYVDSLFITNHFNGSYAAMGERQIKYLEIVKQLSMKFDLFNITQIPREDNAEADALANLASALKIPEGTTIPIIHILSPKIEKKKEVSNTEAEEADIRDLESSQRSWIPPVIKYLQDGEFQKDEKNHRAFPMRISRFIILDGVLYRKSIASPYLKCLKDPEAFEVLKDIHEGDCENHTGVEHSSQRS
ncbi:hypothetical protein L1987_63810 [Smallanthus sonchifolius]|uniref:Uncharacterized protein n=1 Tax=Smallanthus sonchifolius TaxID=185202 RepID=A0ACB9CEB9_9ASTR|nr:hypothetical protein L1987_63810 [Smallanthus sonchifolius]